MIETVALSKTAAMNWAGISYLTESRTDEPPVLLDLSLIHI